MRRRPPRLRSLPHSRLDEVARGAHRIVDVDRCGDGAVAVDPLCDPDDPGAVHELGRRHEPAIVGDPAARASGMRSSKPAVVRSPSCRPERVASTFVTTVVPRPNRPSCARSSSRRSPRSAATSSHAATTAPAGSEGSDGTLSRTWPASVVATMSVNVPPTSTPSSIVTASSPEPQPVPAQRPRIAPGSASSSPTTGAPSRRMGTPLTRTCSIPLGVSATSRSPSAGMSRTRRIGPGDSAS